MAALFPGRPGTEGFWREIVTGTDLITDVPESHWRIDDFYDPDPNVPDKTYAKRGAFLREVGFDAMAWGIPPTIVPATDTSQLLALMVAEEALKDALGDRYETADRSRISVILGVTSAQKLMGSMTCRMQRPVWERSLREAGVGEEQVERICERIASHYATWQESTFPGLLGNVVAGRIANRMDLGGTNCVTDAACASAFSAVSMALDQLWLGTADMVLTGGADTMSDIFMFMCFGETTALSPTGDCRPFSDRADGTLLGEGLGMAALKRLADAERDGDRIWAVIRGIGSSSDGRATSVYAPVPEGQARALARAYASAGYGPETVELVEAHGTGTKAGDVAEVEGLRMVFEGCARGACALGSVKSQIGHTRATAGAAGLIKAVLALNGKVLPPTVKVDRPNPLLNIESSPFYLNTRARPWVRGVSHPRRASVSSFGFGGSNYHVTLEEYVGPVRAPRIRAADHELVLLGAASSGELAEMAESLGAEVDGEGWLTWLAWKSTTQFDWAQGERLALVASDERDLVKKLRQAAKAVRKGQPFVTPDGVAYGNGEPAGGVGFLFPGQGSQYPDMGAALAMFRDEALAVWDQAADSRLHEVVFPRPAFDEETRREQASRLTETEWAQPAIGCASLATLAVLRQLGLEPDAAAGHSFGEVVALHAAGVFGAEDTLRIARQRGELTAQAAREPGAMIAVSASLGEVRAVVDALGAEVVMANHNAPRQVVLSGPTAAVDAVGEELERRKITARRLDVATAFHSRIVSSAMEPFAASLENVAFGEPQIPVYANSTAAPYPADPGEQRKLLAGQVAEPVRFVELVEAMFDRGIRTFVEVGPGSVLVGLVDRILGEKPHLAVATDRKGRGGLAAFLSGIGRIAAAGHRLHLEALWDGHAVPRDPETRTPPQLEVTISGANPGNPLRARPETEPSPISPEVPTGLPTQPPPRELSDEASEAWLEVQRQTAHTHEVYLRAMADSHAAFLQAAEAGLASIGGGELPSATEPTWATALPPLPVSTVAPSPTEEPIVEEGPPTDIEAVLLDVVAEKTGYPVEMLNLGMKLEGDLGIDSIKRVEILSALSDRNADMPEWDAGAMAGLTSLGDIVGHITAATGGAICAPAPAVPERAATPSAKCAPAEGTHTELGRYVPSVVEAEPLGLAMAGLLDGEPLLVTEDGTDLPAAVVAALGKRGVPATLVSDVPVGGRKVLLMAGMRPVAGVEEAIAANREAFAVAKAMAKALDGGDDGVLIVVQDTGGTFGLEGIDSTRAWLSGSAALARTAAQEWAGCSVRAIDLARGDLDSPTLADRLANELLVGGAELDVGLPAEGRRLVLTDAPEAAERGSAPFENDDVVIVSGGGRAVTAACTVALAREARGAPAFVLLGRTKLEKEPACCAGARDLAAVQRALADGSDDSVAEIGRRARRVLAAREVRETLRALEETGAVAHYHAVDVTDADAVHELLDGVRLALGPITGVVHGAGVVADKKISDKTHDAFDQVFDTKVEGLRALLEATANDPIRLLCVFSSVAARCGNRGQVDYAMANEVLNKVARAERFRRGPSCHVKALGWGPWRGGMVSPELERHFESMGVPLIPLEDGARMLVDELGSCRPDQVEVGIGGRLQSAAWLSPGEPRPLEVSIRVDRRSHPYLADHLIAGLPVLPVALVVEWFTRTTRRFQPDLQLAGLSDLRVLHGVRLAGFDDDGDVLSVRCGQCSRDGDHATVDLELVAADGTLHYAATASLVQTRDEPCSGGPPSLRLDAWDAADIYGGALFHGPEFQVIRSVQGVSDAGIAADLSAVREHDWLDGGLQLALLWAEHTLGLAMLPTRVGEVRFWTDEPPRGRLSCVVEGREANERRAITDMTLVDAQGRLVAELREVEIHARPDATPHVLDA
jgi:acyl transferase domain-containing protein/acyl carrier protein